MSIEHREVRKDKYTCGDNVEMSASWEVAKTYLKENVKFNKLRDVIFKESGDEYWYEGINEDGDTVKIGYFDEG